MTIAEFQNVSRKFGNGIEALAGFDLKLIQGERVALLGPSGCGKTTALRILAGLDHATEGHVSMARGRDDVCGYVFQEPTLLPWATVENNVAMPWKIRGMGERERLSIARDMLVRVGLEDFAKAYPRELSGGMKMRVSIARALITRPTLLLMDEPFAALDEITRFRLNDLLLRQQEAENFTLVFVTHSVFESVYLSDRVLVMSPRPGRVVAEIETTATGSRDANYRLSEPYLAHCRSVSAALDDAMRVG